MMVIELQLNGVFLNYFISVTVVSDYYYYDTDIKVITTLSACTFMLWAHMQFGHISSMVYWQLDNWIHVHWTMYSYAVRSANRSISTANRFFLQCRLDKAANKSMPYLHPYAVCPATNAPSCILVRVAYAKHTDNIKESVGDFRG